MCALFPLGSGTIHAVAVIDMRDVDAGSVVDLAVRPAAERAANAVMTALRRVMTALRRVMTALRRVMTPPHAPSAQDGTGVGPSAPDLTVSSTDWKLLIDERPSGVTCGRVVEVEPCNA
jgi:hypothetical protein